VVIGAPADCCELVEFDEEVPDESDELAPKESSDEVVPEESDEDEVVPDDDDVVPLDASEVVFEDWPIDPVAPITPKAIANVARTVANTRRRIVRSRAARARSRSAAISRGLGARSVMSSMVGTPPKDALNATWELPVRRTRRHGPRRPRRGDRPGGRRGDGRLLRDALSRLGGRA
jgi:hypothetical protein